MLELVRSHYIALGKFLSVIIGCTMISASYFGYLHTISALNNSNKAYEDRTSIRLLTNTLLNAETGLRGYVLTDDEKYLKPYNEAIVQIDNLQKRLLHQIAKNPEKEHIFKLIQQSIRRKVQQMELVLVFFREKNLESLHFVLFTDLASKDMEDFRENSTKLDKIFEKEIQSNISAVKISLIAAHIVVLVMTLLSIGAFFLYLRQHSLTSKLHEREQSLLTQERHRLAELVDERTASLKELATHLQQVREDERAFLARELHDELGALLTAAKLDVTRLKAKIDVEKQDIAERIQHLNDTLNSGIALKRRLVEDLHPSALKNLGLTAAIEILVKEFGQRIGIDIQSHIDPVELGNDSIELTVYRLIQESLTNLGKYAQASEVSVQVIKEAKFARIQVKDNGVGFDASTMRPNSHGLAGMRHRVEAIGGALQIDSTLGHGTTIRAVIPLANI